MSETNQVSFRFNIYNINWRGIEIEITHVVQWTCGINHIEIRSKDRAASPITETGYKSHLIPRERFENYGDAVVYDLAWLDHQAKCKA